ncbi:DUF167 family protein [Oceanisphaera avium]|uniref:UPF0235 protein CBP12_08215 n=1 Tax=Oceanisphaera avium TaxID=1903694 RepID=A0A1Y0CXT0_9GAMM|nr:DUF167 family protein [Oceanisphaera avium]ART80131.1 YggU family protein [Oceanisphaera avium]
MAEPVTLAVQLINETLALRIYLQPKASRDQFVGLHDGALKIAITAPPIEGKANKHLLKWLAKQCRVAQSQVRLQSGVTSRHKQVIIQRPTVIPAPLLRLLDKAD